MSSLISSALISNGAVRVNIYFACYDSFYNVIEWIFSDWPYYRSEGSYIGLRIAVLAQGEAEGQYSHPKANNRANAKTSISRHFY